MSEFLDVSSRKRKSDTIIEVKDKLRNNGVSFWTGNKLALIEKLTTVEQIIALVSAKPVNQYWSVDDFNTIMSLLPEDKAKWELKDVEFVWRNFNSHSCETDVLTDANREFIKQVYNLYQSTLIVDHGVTAKSEVISADSLVPMIDKLAKKAPSKWGEKEISLLNANLSNVHSIDGNRSSFEAVQKYRDFVTQLNLFYFMRPDVRARME